MIPPEHNSSFVAHMVRVTERRTRRDWAHFVEEIADQYDSADKITLVMDNLNTH